MGRYSHSTVFTTVIRVAVIDRVHVQLVERFVVRSFHNSLVVLVKPIHKSTNGHKNGHNGHKNDHNKGHNNGYSNGDHGIMVLARRLPPQPRTCAMFRSRP